jgi:integrase
MQLPHDARVGKITVHPSNWDQADIPGKPGPTTKEDWYIFYRWHHPAYPKPKGNLIILKGMNEEKKLSERRKVVRGLIENEIGQLKAGWNPITRKLIPVKTNDLEIPPSYPFVAAFDKAYNLLAKTSSKAEVRKALPHFKKAMRQMKYENLPIGEVRQHHLEVLLIQIGRNKKEEYDNLRTLAVKYSKNTRPSRQLKAKKKIPTEWGASGFNHYRSYLQMLFKILKKVGATEVKPVDDIEKRMAVKKRRKGITADEMNKINTIIRDKHYTFWRFITIFYRSGAREAELMRLKKEDVELQGQRFHVLIKKGKGQHEEVPKTITKEVLHLWEEVMREARRGEYLFSKDLRPGAAAISPRQITIRWRWHVKEKLGIEADFYELKHKNTTQVISIALRKIDEATKVAAVVNNHKSTDMSRKVYDLEADQRLHRELKNVSAEQ